MILNINQTVRVKLTPLGKVLHREDHEKFGRDNKIPNWKYTAPEEDENGWSTWQLWTLMQAFGKHLSLGFYLPFETDVEIVEEGNN